MNAIFNIHLGLYFDWSSLLGEGRERRLQTINDDLHIILRIWTDGIIPQGAWSDLIVLTIKLIALQNFEVFFNGQPIQQWSAV